MIDMQDIYRLQAVIETMNNALFEAQQIVERMQNKGQAHENLKDQH